MVLFKGPDQTIKPGGVIVFDDAFVYGSTQCVHRDGSGVITLPSQGCACMSTGYEVAFGCNVAFPTTVPAGETAADTPLTLAFAISGEPDTTTEMQVTPAAADEYFNVSRTISVGTVGGCCVALSIENTSNGTVSIQSPTLMVKEAR